jgi:Xaa-Pro aminopeptidase
MSDRHVARQQKLLRIVHREKVEALLVTGETNVSYLTGFSGDSSYLLIGPGHRLMVSDFRYVTQLAEECRGLDTFIRKPDLKLPQAAVKVLKSSGVRKLGIEGHLMSVEFLEFLRKELPQVEFVAVNSKIENELRAIKDPDEVAEIREAVRHAERGLELLRTSATPDTTERQAAHELEHAMRRFGADGVSFPPIIAVDDRAALPHYRAGSRRLGGSALLLVDWGAVTPRRYVSDLTRTLVTGKPTAKLKQIYEIVLRAQQAAIDAIRPGAKCIDVDKIARDVIGGAGYGKRFGHGLGHGIGLHVHEQPRFAPSSTDVLRPGMVVTVEPGIYLPGWGGVRIEDDVLVTRDGCEVLSASVPKQFDQMVLNW